MFRRWDRSWLRSVTEWCSSYWHDLVSKHLVSFSRQSKMSLESRLENTVVFYIELVHSISISSHVKLAMLKKLSRHQCLIFRRIQLQSRRTTPAREARVRNIFPCFTVCIFARNLERDGLGRVGSANRAIPFHSSHGIPEISNRNFWSNGKRH